MFGIGIPELVIILIVALLVVGPSKLPELARSMGKALGEFRRLADDVKDTLEQEMAKEPEKEEETHKEAQKEEQQEEQHHCRRDGHQHEVTGRDEQDASPDKAERARAWSLHQPDAEERQAKHDGEDNTQ